MKIYLASLIFLITSVASAQSGIEIVTQRRGADEMTGMAAPVTEQIVITKSVLLKDSDSLVIIDPGTGARIQGQVLYQDQKQDGLALARFPGANFTPLPIATRPFFAGEEVGFLTGSTPRTGRVLSVSPDGGFTHDIAYQVNEVGGMLVNRCDELAGLNVDVTRGFFGSRLAGSDAPVKALSFAVAQEVMRENGVEFQPAGAACPTAEEQLAADLERRKKELEEQQKAAAEAASKAAARDEAAKKEKEELEKQQEETEARLEESRKKAGEAAEALQETQQKAEEAAAQLEAEQQAKEQAINEAARINAERRKTLYFAAAGAIALLILLLFALNRLRRRKTELRAAKARFADVLLTGNDAGGNPYRLRIDGGALMQAENGLVIGKQSAQAQLIIPSAQVSRTHARVWVENRVLMITDLGSSNGTKVNGEAVSAGRKVALKDGDEVAFGGVFLTIQLLQN